MRCGPSASTLLRTTRRSRQCDHHQRQLTCKSGCPATICKNRSNPSLRPSITSSVNRLVNTLPGNAGIFTRVLSRSRMSRKYSKSEYRRRTELYRILNAGMFVFGRRARRDEGQIGVQVRERQACEWLLAPAMCVGSKGPKAPAEHKYYSLVSQSRSRCTSCVQNLCAQTSTMEVFEGQTRRGRNSCASVRQIRSGVYSREKQ